MTHARSGMGKTWPDRTFFEMYIQIVEKLFCPGTPNLGIRESGSTDLHFTSATYKFLSAIGGNEATIQKAADPQGREMASFEFFDPSVPEA